MSNDNNLNDIIKSKFSAGNSGEHPFDEANWKSMRTMIDNSRAKKKRTLFLIGSLALLLCVGGAIGIYGLNNQGGKSNSGNVAASAHTASPSSAVNNNVASNSTAQAVNPSLKVSNDNVPDNTTNSAAVVDVKPIQANANNAVAAAANSVPQPMVKNKKHKAKSGYSGITASNKEIADLNKTMADIEKNTTVKNVISSGESSYTSSPTTPPLPVNSTPPIVPKTAVPPVTQTVAKAPDTASSLPQRFSDEPRIFMGEKQMFSFDAGVSYTGGWGTGISTTQGKGWDYIVGLGYTRYLKSKLFLKTGLQFSDMGNMGTYTFHYESSSAQNPKILNDSVITTKRLYYLSVPVQLEYYIGHKSSLGLGGSVSYLLGTKTTAGTYQEFENNTPVNINNYTEGIHLEGYNTFTGTAYVLYRVTYNRHFSAYGMLYFMTPVENRSFFIGNIYRYDEGLKFLLSYTL